MRLRVRLTLLAARRLGLTEPNLERRDVVTWAEASASWCALRDKLGLSETDLVSVVVAQQDGRRVASVGWSGSVWNTVPSDFPDADAELLYRPADWPEAT